MRDNNLLDRIFPSRPFGLVFMWPNRLPDLPPYH